ncbi:MAG: single-stranded DNA-binding protein [Anaerolineae bacterium]
MNVIQVEGALTENPKLERRGGKLKLSFRLAIPRPDSLPAKYGNNADFVTVVRYANSLLERLLLTLDHAYLQKGTRVRVTGWLQSRDISRGRTATEIVAQSITYLGGTSRKGDEILAHLNVPEPTF